MQRRQFLAASLAAGAMGMVRDAAGQTAAKGGREYYQIRKYGYVSGPQTGLAQSYFKDALIPALTKLGMGPVGVFSPDFGPETPTHYVLIPGSSAEALVEVDLHLAEDAEFLKAAEPFWSAPAVAPSFGRVEYTLLKAFEGYPKLTLPSMSATKAKRIFQMRTYESPSYRDHVRKVEMFNAGEFDIFKTAGFESVFYGDTLIGSRMPSLTYMLALNNLEELNGKWDKFRDAPAWKKLSGEQKYSFEAIVSNITNLVLTPLGCSQI